MNAIKILRETRDTVTVSKDDWTSLLSELDDSQDRKAVADRRAHEAAIGKEIARRNYLAADEARRLLAGENPVKVWRDKRGLSQRALARDAHVSASYLAEIETGAKPGSVEALGKLAAVLEVGLEELMSDQQRMRDPNFGPVLLRFSPHSVGVAPGQRAAELDRVPFKTLGKALEGVRGKWASLRQSAPFITDEKGYPIYNQDGLYELMDPDLFRALRRQARR